MLPGTVSAPLPTGLLYVGSGLGSVAPLLQRRDGKNVGEKVSRDSDLRHSMPTLFRRFPCRHERTSMAFSMVSAVGLRADRCR